ncbi:hypothetical protein [Nodularia spumigena]|nr:hypothetical protein [Nodularia spumigena]AHJ30039.1 hypothetical protein NSP_37360 [Nodularia spumigena CCY9414]MDB9360520.1 hypothetical protein [Nodularia spumigena CS-588/02]MDB9363952.1 hypothetical protein [Nodularia spumigena CS-588/02A10]MEA5523487.1 hypothetical protein [Nodularia spumigena UHCC 0143]
MSISRHLLSEMSQDVADSWDYVCDFAPRLEKYTLSATAKT